MSIQDVVEEILSELTPARLRKVILDMVEERCIDGPAGLSLFRVVDALAGARDLGSGAEGWRARIKIKGAVIEMLDQVPEMKYVEGDA